MEAVASRFIRYAKINTQSDPGIDSCPSTAGQMDLAKILYDELVDLGLKDVNLNEDGYLWATLSSNTKKTTPIIGFLAHLDTSPDFSGENVEPEIIQNYDAAIITLSEKDDILLDPAEFPELNNYIGQDLIVTKGNTLLGADDKAGIAEIMEAMRFLIANPDIKHGEVKVAFTPDEEIGRGADLFPVDKFGADFAFTLDGGPIGELEYENFNAASAKVTIQGRNVHPGTAKNKMINAIQTGIDFHNMLPAFDRPEHTEGYEGFYHLTEFSGTVEKAKLDYIIRDHDAKKFDLKKQKILLTRDLLNKKFGKELVHVEMKDQYSNMREIIEQQMHIIDLASLAMKAVNVNPIIKAIRGGTDGSRLSFMGLPTPNIFTGGHNYHGKFEFIPIQSMVKASEVIIEIIKKATH